MYYILLVVEVYCSCIEVLVDEFDLIVVLVVVVVVVVVIVVVVVVGKMY